MSRLATASNVTEPGCCGAVAESQVSYSPARRADAASATLESGGATAALRASPEPEAPTRTPECQPDESRGTQSRLAPGVSGRRRLARHPRAPGRF
jgi:hypothetical protein